jgi:phosphoenolpyruvate carboxylase
MDTAQDYANLCTNKDLSHNIFNLIQQENKNTIDLVLQISRVERLLEKDPLLELSLTRRDPYLDPLCFIQINLLGKFRNKTSSEPSSDSWRDALLSTINAIAAGMRNTG